MLKKSREMDAEWALQVLKEAPFATLSMTQDDGTPYAVPISIAVADENTIYFHCAMRGHKLDCIRKQPKVSITAVSRCTPTVGPKAREFTLQFKSAIANGQAAIVEDDAEKIKALRAICERFLPQNMDMFEASIARSLKITCVVRVTLTEPPVGKRKQYDKEGHEMTFGRME